MEQLRYRDFEAETVDAEPTGITKYGTSTTYEVKSNSTLNGSRLLKLSSSGDAHNWFRDGTVPSVGDYTLKGLLYFDTSATGSLGLCFRADSSTCYFAALRNGNSLRLGKLSTTTETIIQTVTIPTLETDKAYWLKISVNGSEIKVRYWRDGDEEPEYWQIEATDTTYDNTKKGIGVYSYMGNLNDAFVDDILCEALEITPSDYLYPNRKVKVSLGFDDEFIDNFGGRSEFPEVDTKMREASFHFFDELEYLSQYKLSGGSLQLAIRTDRYIWGILDDVYADYFEVLANCDTTETWTNTTDETTNHRGGDGCKKIESTGSVVSGYTTFTPNKAFSGDETHLDFFLYLSSLTDLDSLVIRLEKTADTDYYEYNLESDVVEGWNEFHIAKDDFTLVGSGDLADIDRLTIRFKSNTATTAYVLIDEFRFTEQKGYPRRYLDTGIQTIPVAWWAGNTALYEIKTACEAEGARFYADENGELRFENRQHYALNDEHKSSKWQFDFDNSIDMDYVGKIDDVINKVIVRLKPRKVVAEKEIWRYGFVPFIEAGDTKTIWAEFVDPCPTTSTGIVTPVATTDYTANTAEDGSGTDKTADISIAITKFATASIIEVENTGASDVYLTMLKLRGTPAEESDESRVIVEDATSILNYGVQPSGGLEIENKYMADEAYAETIAQQLIDWYKSPVRRITLKNRCVPQLQLGDMINVKNTALDENYLMRIVSIKNIFSLEDGLLQEIRTRSVTNFETLDYFTIGTSEIASTDVIAP